MRKKIFKKTLVLFVDIYSIIMVGTFNKVPNIEIRKY